MYKTKLFQTSAIIGVVLAASTLANATTKNVPIPTAEDLKNSNPTLRHEPGSGTGYGQKYAGYDWDGRGDWDSDGLDWTLTFITKSEDSSPLSKAVVKKASIFKGNPTVMYTVGDGAVGDGGIAQINLTGRDVKYTWTVSDDGKKFIGTSRETPKPATPPKS